MKNEFDKLNRENLIDLTSFPFNLKLQSSDTDNKWNFYLTGLRRDAPISDKRVLGVGINKSSQYIGFADIRVVEEDNLSMVLKRRKLFKELINSAYQILNHSSILTT